MLLQVVVPPDPTVAPQEVEPSIAIKIKTIFPELARILLASMFAVIFGATVWIAMHSTSITVVEENGKKSSTDNWTNMKELLQILLPAETALLGSAVGFYFGSQQR